MKQDYQTANIIRWAARITSVVGLGLILYFVFGDSFVDEEFGVGFNTITEVLTFICFPVITIVGFALGWKWEGIGGMITMGGTMGFFILNANSPAILYIMVLTAPGLLFLIYWFLANGRKPQTSH